MVFFNAHSVGQLRALFITCSVAIIQSDSGDRLISLRKAGARLIISVGARLIAAARRTLKVNARFTGADGQLKNLQSRNRIFK